MFLFIFYFGIRIFVAFCSIKYTSNDKGVSHHKTNITLFHVDLVILQMAVNCIGIFMVRNHGHIEKIHCTKYLKKR